MSDDLDEEQNEEEHTPKQLREAAKRGRDAEARAAAAERELAFARAGVDLTDPRTGYFVRGYDGELDPSKIKEAAERDGFLSPPDKPAVSPEESQAIQRISNATEGADEPSAPDAGADMRDLAERGQKERWTSEEFTMELAKLAQRSGLPVAYDGAPFPTG